MRNQNRNVLFDVCLKIIKNKLDENITKKNSNKSKTPFQPPSIICFVKRQLMFVMSKLCSHIKSTAREEKIPNPTNLESILMVKQCAKRQITRV